MIARINTGDIRPHWLNFLQEVATRCADYPDVTVTHVIQVILAENHAKMWSDHEINFKSHEHMQWFMIKYST